MTKHGDLFDVLPTLPEASVDACVTDPPYDLTSNKRGGSGEASLNLNSPAGRSRISTGGGFMGKEWDGQGVAFKVETWREVFRVLKPGAYLVAFGGTRTFHRMTCAVEDAGFEIRDCLSWLYGQGFPKSLNLGDGRGTALKPAWEPAILARKPLRGTVAANVAEFGTGTLNIETSRIGTDERVNTSTGTPGGNSQRMHGGDGRDPVNAQRYGELSKARPAMTVTGRWPANVCLDEQAAAMLDEQSGELTGGFYKAGAFQSMGFQGGPGQANKNDTYGDTGGASRFFYVAKPSRAEREEGIYDLPETAASVGNLEAAGRDATNPNNYTGSKRDRVERGLPATKLRRNTHPTVKPVELMRWLVRLVTPCRWFLSP